MSEVRLSTSEFKALSSSARTQVLKLLKERNYTLTELASKLDMAAPTVKQHLNVLLDSGLIELRDEGRKWKYYALTRKGRKIVFQEQTQFLIILSLASLAFITLLLIFLSQGLMAPPGGTVDKGLEQAPMMTTLEEGLSGADLNLLEQCRALCAECNPFAEECALECEECVG